jgi:polysaccharide export outer membrane protein
MKSRIVVLLSFCLFSLASCTSLKEMIYFQNKKATTIPPANVPNPVIPVHVLAVGDVINLVISTPLQTSDQILNQKGGSGFQIRGDSTIEIPVLGNVKLAGLTLAAAKDTLFSRANIYFNQPFVNLSLVTFRVTVLGEVSNPGIKLMVSEKSTLLDAIALSGDLTGFGNRTNIQVLRGDKTFLLDITDMEIFKADGFYLQSNDVVYVQPLRKKNTMSNLSTALTVSSFASVVSVLITTLLLFRK